MLLLVRDGNGPGRFEAVPNDREKIPAPLPARPAARRKGRRRRGKDLTGFGLAMSGVAIVAVLALCKPPLPGWLPRPVVDSLLAIERLGGD